jgi:hypothetical protein
MTKPDKASKSRPSPNVSARRSARSLLNWRKRQQQETSTGWFVDDEERRLFADALAQHGLRGPR